MKDTRHDEVKCVRCGHLLDCATSIEGTPSPQEGDVTVCAYCNCVMEYTEGLRLKEASAETLAMIDLTHLQKAHKLAYLFQDHLEKKK